MTDTDAELIASIAANVVQGILLGIIITTTFIAVYNTKQIDTKLSNALVVIEQLQDKIK